MVLFFLDSLCGPLLKSVATSDKYCIPILRKVSWELIIISRDMVGSIYGFPCQQTVKTRRQICVSIRERVQELNEIEDPLQLILI